MSPHTRQPDYVRKAGDIYLPIEEQFREEGRRPAVEGEPLSIEDANSVRFYLEYIDTDNDPELVVNASADSVDETTGEVEYHLKGGELSREGRHLGYFVARFGDDRRWTAPSGDRFIVIDVVEPIDHNQDPAEIDTQDITVGVLEADEIIANSATLSSLSVTQPPEADEDVARWKEVSAVQDDVDAKADRAGDYLEPERTHVTHHVGPGEAFTSINDAYNALPPGGGSIRLEGTIKETDIVFEEEKPVCLTGQGTIFDRDWPITLDTSGGDGIHLKGRGHVIRDLHIEGDGTGGYGLRLGSVDGFSGRFYVENVSVRGKGGPGVHYIGRQINSYYDVVAHECNIGQHIDMAEADWYLGEVTWRRLGAHSSSNQGILIDGPGTLIGNNVQQIWSEVNDGAALEITVSQFQGNQITGYGMEAGETIITPDDTDGEEGSKWNTLTVRRAGWPLTVDYNAFARFETREVSYVEGVGLIASPRNSLTWIGDQAADWDIKTIRIPNGTWGKIEPHPGQEYIGESKDGVRIESTETNGVGFNTNEGADAKIANMTVAAPSSGVPVFADSSAERVKLEDIYVPGSSDEGVMLNGVDSRLFNVVVDECNGDEIRLRGDRMIAVGCTAKGTITEEANNIELAGCVQY